MGDSHEMISRANEVREPLGNPVTRGAVLHGPLVALPRIAGDSSPPPFLPGQQRVWATALQRTHGNQEVAKLLSRAPSENRVAPSACACAATGGSCASCAKSGSPPAPSPPAAEGSAASLGPLSDNLDDAANLGPDDAGATPAAAKQMGCVRGPLQLTTSGSLQGGWTVNDYLSGGLRWPGTSAPGTAGADGRGFKVQMYASYSGDTSLGVSQNFTFSGANQAFLDAAAAYLGQAPGSVTNGTRINEPVLDASNPYASRGWSLLYGAKGGGGNATLVSFADVPRMLPGCQGSAVFETCFYSLGGPCQENSVCRNWTWTIDFTGSNTTNTVT